MYRRVETGEEIIMEGGQVFMFTEAGALRFNQLIDEGRRVEDGDTFIQETFSMEIKEESGTRDDVTFEHVVRYLLPRRKRKSHRK